MPKATEMGRVILEPSAKVALGQMLSELKDQEEWVRISPSKLASWIVLHFRDQFAEHREQIAKEHFNSKEYLKKIIQDLGPGEDATELLQAALRRMGGQEERKLPRRRRQSHESAEVAAQAGTGPESPASNPGNS